MTALRESPTAPAALGRSIGRYQLLEVLGRGGMGTVYRARQSQLEKLVALKLLDPLRAGKPGAMTRFLREARAAAQIRHPNVVEVFDVGFDDGSAFLAMELLEGHDLAAHLARRGRLELTETLDLLAPVLAGVRAAHEAGVVHRDLKPSNIFLARRGRTLVSPVVLDFGVSRLLDDEELGLGTLTSADTLLGTAAYVAPEQAKQSRSADDRSDQYALGVVLYECATGHRPFKGANTYELLHAIATAPVRPPSQVNPSLPTTFDDVVLRALQRDPEQRFADLDAFAAALMAFAAPRTWMAWGRELKAKEGIERDAEDTRTAPPSQPRPALPPSTRRESSRRGVLGAFALGALSSAAVAWLWTRRAQPVSRAAPPLRTPAARASYDETSRRVTPPPSAEREQERAPDAAPPRRSAVDSKPRPPPAKTSSHAPVELGPNDAPILP
jgi:eukaryotic-like serine/threonine-protein kinase